MRITGRSCWVSKNVNYRAYVCYDKLMKHSEETYSELWLEEDEYAALMSAINNRYKTHYQGKSHGLIDYGDYSYLFRVIEFDEYEFIKKWRIE